jgi:hypothetical protein
MLIIGCDFHTRYQQIAMMDQATGELIEQRAGGPSFREVAKGWGVYLNEESFAHTLIE